MNFKKIILLSVFLLVPLFFANGASAAAAGWYQVAFSVVSIQIPARAAILSKPTNMEFFLSSNGYFEIAKNGNPEITSSNYAGFLSGMSAPTLTYEDDGTSTYTARIRIIPSGPSTNVPGDDCQNQASASYYITVEDSKQNAMNCPVPPFISTSDTRLSVGNTYPLIFTIATL